MPTEEQAALKERPRVMVSGDFTNVRGHRDVLYQAILLRQLSPVSIEESQAAEYHMRTVQETDGYIGFISYKYRDLPANSTLNPEEFSIAEFEFNEALRLDLPILMFIVGGKHDLPEQEFDPDPEKRRKLDAFRERVVSLSLELRFRAETFDSLEEFVASAAPAIDELNAKIRSKVSTKHEDESSPTATATPSAPPAQKKAARKKAPSPQTTSTTKPLIYFSFGRGSEFYEDLKTKLENYKDEVEWWDDSKIPTGSNLPEELESAINRASLAVILLSPPYLEYRATKDELAHLVEQANYRGLRLFPIVVQDCAWRELEPLKNLQVWASGKPVGELNRPTIDRELDKITKAIVEQALQPLIKPPLPPPPPDPAGELIFSKAAQDVLNEAKELASRSDRAGVTSSCLLFAFAELAREEDSNTSRFLRMTLERTGEYGKAFETFLTDSVSDGRKSLVNVRSFGFEGKTSKNVMDVFTSAANITYRVSRQPPHEIFPRHLLAALLVAPEGASEPIARKRLRRLGIELNQLCREFLEFMRTHAPAEDQAGWATILTSKGYLAGPAGYTSEFCGVGGMRPVEDHLGVKGWAFQLAELIALRETRLPLAIGLFGNWGSGKSHFMNLIDRRLKSLMEEEKERTDGAAGRWCSEIVPIYFNAWHYLDANLWASLVAQIFESLFAHLRPKNDLEKVQKLLEQASGATARAAEEVTIAEDATAKAEERLRSAEATRRSQETVVDALLQGLKSLLPEVKPEKMKQQAADLLGIEKEVKTLGDLQEVVEQAHSLGRIRRAWNIVWKQPGRAWRLTWLVTTLVIVPVVAAAAANYVPVVREWLHGIGRPIAGLITGISTFLLWARPFVQEANRRVRQFENWAGEAEAAQRQARQTPEVKEAKKIISTARANEEAAKLVLADAQAWEKQLKVEAMNLVPERRLGRYIEQRAQSADYRGQLGLVSLARRDFQELSDIFADAEALKERVAKMKASPEPSETTAAEQLEELSRSIDRIVLFVDDLDRCQPEKVVEILQAVHLLLAFPLFAVVVGVDQRCLRQSLRMQFKGLLTQEPESENGNEPLKNKKDLDEDERPATPLDYLEKIFHVPFHLPPMGEAGFEMLIDRLTEPPAPATSAAAHPSSKTEPKNVELPAPPPKDPEPKPTVLPARPLAKGEDKVGSGTSPQRPVTPVHHAETPATTTPDLIGSVPLQRWEREALRAYHPLIQTPRGATRLLNTYRLVRASIPAKEWDEFCGGGLSDGEFRVAMLLLAAAAGYPALAREWFDRLRTTTPAQLFQQGASQTDPAWGQFKKVYDETFTHITMSVTTDLFTKWVDRVERFAF